MLPVLITRPAQQADSLCNALGDLDCQVIRFPMLEIHPVDETPALRKMFLDIDHYSSVIAISRNAAECGVQYVDNFWPQYPVGLNWLAVGPVTANVLSVAGFEYQMPEQRFDSEGLLELACLQNIEEQKILIWRGVGGRETLAKTLRARGAQVDYAELYQRLVPQYNQQQWQNALAEQPLLLVSSGQGLEAIAAQQPKIAQSVRGIIAPSDRVAELARGLGFSAIEIAASAQDNDMIAAVQQWQVNTEFKK